MSALTQNVLAFLAGMGVSMLFIGLIQHIGHLLYPMPKSAFENMEQLKRAIKKLPLAAFLIVEAAYVVGSLAGGYAVARCAASQHVNMALGLAALLTLFGFQNLFAIPHPAWFAVLTTVTYPPLAFLGAQLHMRSL